MSTAVLTRLNSDAWNAELYNSLSFTSYIAAAIRNRTAAISLTINLRRLTSKLDEMLKNAHSLIEGEVPPPPGNEPFTPQRAHDTIDTLQMISRILSYTYESAKRNRLTNNSLLATPLNRLNPLAEEILDLADWLETLALQSGDVENIFGRAAQEKEHGEIYDLSQVD